VEGAARLVVARAGELDGDHYEILSKSGNPRWCGAPSAAGPLGRNGRVRSLRSGQGGL
jgi:hypothetical protein